MISTWNLASGCPAADLVSDRKPESGKAIPFRLDQKPRSKELLRTLLKACRETPDNPVVHLEVGITYLNLADTSKWNYLTEAVKHLKKARKNFPHDPLVLVYLGRAIGARALNMDPSTFKRLNWAREGFKYMDSAVRFDSKCFYLRLLRGEAQLMAHPILRRGSRLDQDARFITNFIKKEEYNSLPDYQKARIQLFLGNYLQKRKKDKEDIRYHWESTIQLADNTPYAREARARLSGTFRNPGYDGKDEG